jgi:glycine/D-amino acid oxidase-like deaminating enzyme
MTAPRTVVVGAGIFGVTAALELRARGHEVTLVEQGSIPNPFAASTDVSKVIRMEYGPDEHSMSLAEEARRGWHAWNGEWMARGGEQLYHETGVLMVTRAPMAPGEFEFESHRLLERRGHRPERIDGAVLADRFPAWSTGRYVDGFYHEKGGWVESGRVVESLVNWARARGVTVDEGRRVAAIARSGGRIAGVRDATGATIDADLVVVASGSWTAQLAPELATCIRPTGHPVVHLRPRDPGSFRSDRFPVFTADIARTGFYGFPLNRDGVIKIGNHGPGVTVDPGDPPRVAPEQLDAVRAFLEVTFPTLTDAELVHSRICPYADTQDGDLWIAGHPELGGLTVASGGSGHGFKFAPLLGGLIADAVEGRTSTDLKRFRWRPEVRLERGLEAARWHGDDPNPPLPGPTSSGYGAI